MSAITKQAYANYTLKDRQEFAEILPVFKAFQTNPDQLKKSVYASQYTRAVIATGTVANSTTQPILARKYQNNGSIPVYGTAGRPASVYDTIGTKITVASASDGARFTGVTVSVDPTGFICFVAKVSASITTTFKLNTTAGTDSRDFAFDTSAFTADSNGYTRFISPLAVGTYTGVTVSDTGTFDASSIVGLDVIGSGAATIDFDSWHEASNIGQFIGSEMTMEYACLDEVSWERTLDVADMKCFNYVTGQTPTNKGYTITLKQNDLNMKGQAMGMGEVVQNGTVDLPIIQNAENYGNTNESISAGAMTIANLDAQRIMSVRIDEIVLDRVETVGLVNETTYHYNEGTGAFTFSTTYNGKFPVILYNSSVTGNYFDDRNLKTGFVGNLTVTRISESGKKIAYIFPKAEIIKVTPEQGDAQVSHSYELKVYPFRVGTDYRFYRQVEV